MPGKRKKPDPDDLLHGIKFVKLTTVHDLAIAEGLQKALREGGVGAVIINDEEFQAREDKERADVTSIEGFRIEVPEPMVEKARKILQDIERQEEE